MDRRLADIRRKNIDSSYSRSTVGMGHQSAISEYVWKFLDKLRVLVSAAKRYYDRNQIYFSMFNEFNDLFNEYNQQVENFRNIVLRNEMLRRDLKKLKSKLVGQLVDILGDRVCLLLEVITDSENVPLLDRIEWLNETYKLVFSGIKEKFENIYFEANLPEEFKKEADGEKLYYEHLRRTYSEEIENLFAECRDENSFTSLRSTMYGHTKKLRDMLEKIRKLAAGERVDDSFTFSDDDSPVSDDDSSVSGGDSDDG